MVLRMNVDVVGRVNNLKLPRSKALLPVQEAVVNSIQAIGQPATGEIKVIVERDLTQPPLDDERYIYPVAGFRIIDNGTGFDDKNYNSFLTSDTTLKAGIGGKGIGRFLWLKLFESAHISSTFMEKGHRVLRSFDFVLTPDAVENHSTAASDSAERRTEVRLRNVREPYQQALPKRVAVIAQRILEHTLTFFIVGTAPEIVVVDSESDETISLRELYEDHVENNNEKVDLRIRDAEFRADIIRYPTTSESTHKVSYCAHSREVRSEKLSDTIPLLSRRLVNGDEEFVYMVYVTGEYFDATVNQERTAFTFDESVDDQEELGFSELIPMKEIRDAVADMIKANAEEYIEPIREEHHRAVADFVYNNSPEYRHVIKYRSADLDTIPPGTTGEKLELALHQISQSMEREVKESGTQLLSAGADAVDDVEDYKRQYNELVDKVTEIGQASLSRYVIHRKLILNLLEKRLGMQDSGKYPLEEAIHEIVIPLRTTSDDSAYSRQNLWIVDEKLAYHYFLASDKPLRSMDVTASESRSRPDVVVFNRTLAFTEDDAPYSSIVVVEFKRPVRDDYSDEDNPIDQVLGYIDEIRSNQARDKNGRPVSVSANTPFYAYIVCDITSSLRRIVNRYGYFETPDPGGYFFFNSTLKAYIEIISFDKLIADAKKRNRVLFDRLGISPDL